MRELDESAVRSWARTSLFDPFVTHMVVGQHWNSTPFPFGALYDARNVRANPEHLFALMGNALIAIQNPVTDSIDRELELGSIHKTNRASQDEEIHDLLTRSSIESASISNALSDIRIRFAIEVGVPRITGSTVGVSNALFDNSVFRSLPVRLRADDVTTLDIVAQSSVLVVALQLWDMFTTVFNRTVGIKNCIDERLALHSLLADVAFDIYNDGHAGTGLTRKLDNVTPASVAEEVEKRIAEARPICSAIHGVDFRRAFASRIDDESDAPLPITLMAAALLSSPSDMLRVLQVASTRYTGEKK